MSELLTIRELYGRAFAWWMENSPRREFEDKILWPLKRLALEEDKRELEEIKRLGT